MDGRSPARLQVHVHANVQAHWRGIVGRRYVQELRRERAAHKIADAWLTFTIRRSFLDLRRYIPDPRLCPLVVTTMPLQS